VMDAWQIHELAWILFHVFLETQKYHILVALQNGLCHGHISLCFGCIRPKRRRSNFLYKKDIASILE